MLAIGGLKEKTMAAYKSGVSTVYIPKANLPDIEEIDPVVREALRFVPAESFLDVIMDATVEPIVASDKISDKKLIIHESKSNSASVRQ